MKRMITGSRYNEYDNWDPKDIKLHQSIDWKARNYDDYPVPEDSFEFEAYKYSLNRDPEEKVVKMIKYIRANPIYRPYYAPETRPFDDCVGPMYDGDKMDFYDIHNRYETQQLYDMLSK